MKKISLKNMEMQGVTLLSKEELKAVMGGFVGTDGDDGGKRECPDGMFWCTCDNGAALVGFCSSNFERCWDAC